MDLKLIAITALLAVALASAGCTMPGASPTPTPTPVPTAEPTIAPTATAIVNASTPTPSPVPTATPTPTPVPVYTNGSPVSVSNIRIDWDTTQYEGQAHEKASMTINNVNKDTLVLDVVVLYKVTTPTTVIDPDGTVHNLTNTVTRTQNIGIMQWEDQKNLTFDVDHGKNVPVTVSVVVQWRGGQATVFQQTLNMADHSLGTYEF